MTLQSLNRLDGVRLRFLFCVVAGFMERRLDAEDLSQARFWMRIAQAVERERDGEKAQDLDFDELVDVDVEVAAKVCAGLAGGQVSATTEFFRELADQLEVELQRRRREIIALERLV